MDVVSALVNGDSERERAGEKEKASAETAAGSGTSGTSLRSSSSSSSLATLASNGNVTSAANPTSSGNSGNTHQGSSQNTPRYSSSTFSILPSSGSSASNYNTSTLRNGAGWVRDEDAAICMVCMTTKFGVLVRKHHCRLCGRVICWKCCQMKDVVLMPEAGSSQPVIPHELRKPIRVCLDCIEEDAAVEQQQKHQQPQPQQPKSQPHSPQSPTFPLQGMFGKLMGSASSTSQHTTSAMNATGSAPTMPLPPQQPFFPRSGRTGHPYPHHHRASLYRIDVECVGEEDEEEEEEDEEEDEEEEVEEAEDVTNIEDEVGHGHAKDPTSDGVSPEKQTSSARQSIKSRRSSRIIHSNHGTIRLKDLDPADINEDEINNQIRTLESEVKNILIQNAPLMFVGAEDNDTKISRHRRHDYMDIDSSSAGKTRVIRGIPKEFLQGTGGFHNEGMKEGKEDNGEEEEGEEEEEKTMEELLAEQDEHVTRMLAC